MIFLPNTTSKDDADARYFIAQYFRNPVRMEPKNVGVIVEKQGKYAARFFAESSPGEYSVRKLRPFQNANAYRLWVDSWRKTLGSDEEDRVSKLEVGANYNVVPGGSVANASSSSASDICNYLYGLIVGDGLAEAFGEDQEKEKSVALVNDIKSEIRKLQLDRQSLTVKHPILFERTVIGANQTFRFPFFQQREDEIWLTTAINFRTKRPQDSRNYATYMNYALDKVSKYSKTNFKYHGIAIVSKPDEISEDVATGLKALSEFSVVNWDSTKEQKHFIAEREDIAYS